MNWYAPSTRKDGQSMSQEMDIGAFRQHILCGVPDELPPMPPRDQGINHAPARPQVLMTPEERKLALQNALRYFPGRLHRELAYEFAAELRTYGRIYMHRFRPPYAMHARPIDHYPAKNRHAAAIMLMIQNNLDPNVAQHPYELITYGGNGTVFQNWAQYLRTMQYLATMTDDQTLILNSGHPLGLFPSSPSAPRLVIANGMMVPNYSTPEEYDRLAALGVTLYGQMTAGSFMYIGSQGIVHGTTITLMNAGRLYLGLSVEDNLRGKLFVSSGLGGMSGAQPKAAKITGAISVIAEINPKAIERRLRQGWLDESYDNLNGVIERIRELKERPEASSIGYLGNVVDLWERLAQENIHVDLGSDQTSLHLPYTGGYYPQGLSFEESQRMMVADPDGFHECVDASLRRQVQAIQMLTNRGMRFWDYGNRFLGQAAQSGADVLRDDGSFIWPSYVEDIMGPLCFDYGFGPFRWVCTSGNPNDLATTDNIAYEALERYHRTADPAIDQQLTDNLSWIQDADQHELVIGSQARILYADLQGRIAIALAFNKAIAEGSICAPIIIGRDHHDVGGTDSPLRETANIRDGSNLTADMAIQNVIGGAFRGATWVSIHNGGGTGWGTAINGGFGLVLDGSPEAAVRAKNMITWDVANGLARRAWAGNNGAIATIKREVLSIDGLEVSQQQASDPIVIERAIAEVFDGVIE